MRPIIRDLENRLISIVKTIECTFFKAALFKNSTLNGEVMCITAMINHVYLLTTGL